MGLPRLERCCCLFDLKTGNIIMGCLNAVLSFSLFVIMIVVATEVGTMENDTAREMEIFKNIDLIEQDARLSGIYAMSVILVLMFLAKFLFDLFFIFGVVTERPGIIKAYFILWIVFTLLSVFLFSINVSYYGVMTIITEVFYISLNVYAILLSYSFYKELSMREDV